jgi:hypothetical protein
MGKDKETKKKETKKKETKKTETKEPKEQTDPNETEEKYLDDVKQYEKSRFALRPIEVKEDDKSTQYIAFTGYVYKGEIDPSLVFQQKGDRFEIRTKGSIPILKGGIPSLDDQWRQTDAKRGYFWLCLTISDKDREYYKKIGREDELQNLEELAKLLKALDNDLFDEFMKKKNKNKTLCLLEKKGKKEVIVPFENLQYNRIVKLSPPPKKGQAEYERYERVKIKFDTKWEKNLGKDDPKEITTKLFVGDDSEQVPSSTPTEIEKEFKWRCSCCMIIQLAKIWVSKTEETQNEGQDDEKTIRKTGCGLKTPQIWVTTRAPTSGGTSTQYTTNVFRKKEQVSAVKKVEAKKEESSDDSSDDEKPASNVKKEASDDESSSEESSDEDEDEDEDEKKPSPKKKEDKEDKEDKKDKKDKEESEESEDTSSSDDESEPEPEPEPKKKDKKNKKK